MALLKAIPSDFGVDATYWKIGAVNEDFTGGSKEVFVFGYANKAARTDGKAPLGHAKIILGGTDYAPDEDRTALYARIKELDAWSGAEDG